MVTMKGLPGRAVDQLASCLAVVLAVACASAEQTAPQEAVPSQPAPAPPSPAPDQPASPRVAAPEVAAPAKADIACDALLAVADVEHACGKTVQVEVSPSEGLRPAAKLRDPHHAASGALVGPPDRFRIHGDVVGAVLGLRQRGNGRRTA